MADQAGTGVPAGFRAVRRVSPTQQVREQLFAAIQRGDYRPGSLLPSERVLGESFGVSRVSVREAIAGLGAMGLITVQHGRGAFVRESVTEQYAGPFGRYLELHREQLLELLKVRGALDELAAEEASLNGTPEGLRRIADACSGFRLALEAEDLDFARLAELDVAFHLSIAQATGGELLPRLLSELNGIFDESRRMTLARSGQLERSAKQHQAIADAILAGGAKAAGRVANRHVDSIRQWVSDLPGRQPAL